MPTPARSRAILSNEDFKLLQEAVRFWIQNNPEGPLTSKYAHLYHRLGSAAGRY